MPVVTQNIDNNDTLKILVYERLPTPLYHQVYLVLRNKILTGEYVKLNDEVSRALHCKVDCLV